MKPKAIHDLQTIRDLFIDLKSSDSFVVIYHNDEGFQCTMNSGNYEDISLIAYLMYLNPILHQAVIEIVDELNNQEKQDNDSQKN